ncbi:2-polyprenyl-6-methoxyphenol hydroxylase [Sphingomonas gellani]|uniref:2-polyprenyl-6-methoxyphenol hydroxylase n=1 Tax=Sphingomonas gellani TaxID=1166340 RepID=A0A1H8GU21_9SPHN|nr:FAD-dependent monooxygenase [Sphingomonas gellani]SEN46758.1 2-polyprenyl-6-methoxyphenol hydroxylase [Sphingomonas gellani]
MASSTITPPAAEDGRPPALVSGASFAGLSTAYWLNRLGYRVTVIEAAKDLRRGGTPVDIEGETIEILTRMGLADAVRARALPPRGFEFKDADDRTMGAIGAGTDVTGHERYEIHRDDLLDILLGAVADTAEILFGRSIDRLADGPEEVSVTFDDGTEGRYALVFGCDGNRSNTRRLVFGDGDQFTYFMGGYVFLKVVPRTDLLPAHMSQVYSVPGRMAMLNGYDDRTDIGFGFRTKGQIAYDYRDRAQQRRLIHDQFDGLGWKVPAMLDSIDADDDFYFDRLNQIRMPSWSSGRVALVGDAGYCVSPLAGFGGSMAIIGAGRLAQALERHAGDHAAAFREYEDGLRPFVEEVQQRAATNGLSTMFPADAAELAERDRKIAAGEIDF